MAKFKFGTELTRPVIEDNKDNPSHFRKGVPFAAGESFPLLRETLSKDAGTHEKMKEHLNYLYAVDPNEEEDHKNG